MISAVFFDLGNTLIYFDSAWEEVIPQAVKAVHQALYETGVKLEAQEFIFPFVERLKTYHQSRERSETETRSAILLMEFLAEHGYRSITEEQAQSSMNALYKVTQKHWHVEEETQQVIEELTQNGYSMAIISNAADDQDVQALVDKAGIRAHMELVLSSAKIGYRKPNPIIFKTVLASVNLSPAEVVMVGDTLNADILGAQQLGMIDVWITRRANTRTNWEELSQIQPTWKIDTLSELPPLLRVINST